MVVDYLKNWRNIFQGEVWEIAFNHIVGLNSNSPEGITELRGKSIYSRVMSYETGNYEKTKVEAHRKYIDIQASLIHGERINWWPLDALNPISEYNIDKDSTYFERNEFVPVSSCILPGMFAVFFPEDAHMPKLSIDKGQLIKKVVIKVDIDLIHKLQI